MKNAEKIKIVNLKGEEVYLDDLELYELYTIAGSEDAKEETLNVLADLNINDSDLIKYRIAENQKTSATTLDKLSYNKQYSIPRLVAAHKNTSAETLDRIASYVYDKKLKNKDYMEDMYFGGIRYEVALNSNTSIETLEKLSKDDCPLVRLTVAQNKNTTADILDNMIYDDRENVFDSIIRNENVSTATLYRMYDITEISFRRFYKRSDNDILTEAIKNSIDNKRYTIKSIIASSPKTPIQDLERLSNDEDWNIKYDIANNPSATSNLLTKLSYEKEKEIRYRTVLNKNVSNLTVLRMLKDPENSIRCAAFDVAKERNLDFEYERVGKHQIRIL